MPINMDQYVTACERASNILGGPITDLASALEVIGVQVSELRRINAGLAQTNQENAEKIYQLNTVIAAKEQAEVDRITTGDLMGLLWQRAWIGNDEEAMWLCDQLWTRRRQLASQRWPAQQGDQEDGDGVQIRWTTCSSDLRAWQASTGREPDCDGTGIHQHELSVADRAGFDAWVKERREARS